MRIVGHGIDVIETERVGRLLDDHGDRFLARCYTAAEQSYIAPDKSLHRRVEYLAGRFAVKEAVLKVLGTGWRDGIAWTDAEVLRLASGQPTVKLHGLCRDIAHDLGINQWWVSISHTRTLAMASAIGVADS